MKRVAIEIQVKVTSDSGSGCARIVAKPCKYTKTRYWVLLRSEKGVREKWNLMPTPDEAFDQVSKWLRKQVIRTFEPNANAIQGNNSAVKVPRNRTGSKGAKSSPRTSTSSPIFYE